MDMMEAWDPTLTDLRSTYNRYFTLACLNVNFESKFALIALICFLTKQARKSNPNATVEQVIKKVLPENHNVSAGLLRALVCICEDHLVGNSDFPSFGAKSAKEIVLKIREILDTEMPFPNPYPADVCPF